MVILDLVMTDKPGFEQEMNRLGVVPSRARDGLYVIANKVYINHITRREGRHLSRHLSAILPLGITIKGDLHSAFYTHGDIDIRGLENDPQTEWEALGNQAQTLTIASDWEQPATPAWDEPSTATNEASWNPTDWNGTGSSGQW